MQKKISFRQLFNTRKVIDIADLVVTKVEDTEEYFIHKVRNGIYKSGDIVDRQVFEYMLSQSKRPIVLSDIYVDLN